MRKIMPFARKPSGLWRRVRRDSRADEAITELGRASVQLNVGAEDVQLLQRDDPFNNSRRRTGSYCSSGCSVITKENFCAHQRLVSAIAKLLRENGRDD
jgi:hypothetical protein